MFNWEEGVIAFFPFNFWIMLKIYTLIHDFSLSTPVYVGEKLIHVVFSGGCKATRQNGEFSTADPELQAALEADPGFGRVYRLGKEYKSVGVKSEKVTENWKVKVCSTVNEATEWLVELGCKKTEVNTSVKAVAAAKELGYVLKFVKGDKYDTTGTDQPGEDED